MNSGKTLLVVVLILAVAAVAGKMFYVKGLQKKLVRLEKERIEVSNKLATAKIVQENLNHVRELVFENMDFPNRKDSIPPESRLFEFITTCVSDLKMKLVSLKPLRPVVQGNITTFGYELEVEGDFFSFGELCAKFENSRRIATLEKFDVSILNRAGGGSGIKASMLVNTYRIRK